MSVIDRFTSRWCISFVGAALLASFAWFFASLLSGLETWPPRVVLVMALFAVWAGANALLDLRNVRRDASLARGVTTATATEATEEAEALRVRLTTALAQLRKSLRGRGYLYQQPWYAIIGPPGAGKTTALLNAGLHFPRADQMGQGTVAGVGGTRLCDWWFTQDAVLIDTAGRYTTQDSNAAIDRAGWEAFLDLLKETRARQPLNGLLVAFPLSDIALAPPAERKAHAMTIRSRIDEVRMRLGVRLPVYMLFTKADLIAGFTEFFDDLDRAKRAQVWGATFDLAADDDRTVAKFAGELRALVERLNARLFDRVQAERNAERRARIALFPGQLASLEPVLMDFLHAAFDATHDSAPLLLRGVYFTSGTQQGTPIDRLTGALARALGLDQTTVPSLQPAHGRGYFLERLLKQVIFGEALLVAYNPTARRRRLLLRNAGYAVTALLVAAMVGLLWHVRGTGQREIDTAAAALANHEQIARGTKLDPVTDDDLPRLAPLLDQARTLLHGSDEPSWLPAMLSQRDKLDAAARAVYRHALHYALLPRLIWRLETQLRGNLNRPDFLYEATRIYLMLGNAGPLDAPLVHEWMKLDWETAYPGLGFAPLRAALLLHLDTLLAEPLPWVQLDGELVAAARGKIAAVSLAQRVYSRIRPSAAAQHLPPWRPVDALGPAGAPLFVRASGKSLTDGIPGLFTVDGFHKVLLPSLSSAIKSVLSESWVLGDRVAFDPNGPQMQALQRDIVALYEADYARAWDLMLADLNVVQLRSLPQAAQDLYILASPESPMRALLASISRQLTLSAPTGRPQPVTVPDAPASDTQFRLKTLLGPSQPAAQAAPLLPGHEIDERYRALRDLVGQGLGAPIDLVLRELGEAQQQIARLAATLVSTGAAPTASAGIDPLLALKTDAARHPPPLDRWLTEMATGAIALRSGDPRQQLATLFNAPGGPAELCPGVVNGHYPFVPTSPDDVSIDGFARLFAPGAAFDGFVNTLLRRYVDTSAKTWRLTSADAGPALVSAADLAQFQRAASIRDTFFADGGTRPRFRLDITPLSADTTTRQATLDLDGTTIVYTRGARRATQVAWPAFSPQPAVRLAFDPPLAGVGELRESGPWALFRLFGHGRMLAQLGNPDHVTLTFQLGDRQAVFDVRLPGTVNPFTPGLLQDFRCPSVRGN
jgi:type VI secretion system protein ImpL